MRTGPRGRTPTPRPRLPFKARAACPAHRFHGFAHDGCATRVPFVTPNGNAAAQSARKLPTAENIPSLPRSPFGGRARKSHVRDDRAPRRRGRSRLVAAPCADRTSRPPRPHGHQRGRRASYERGRRCRRERRPRLGWRRDGPSRSARPASAGAPRGASRGERFDRARRGGDETRRRRLPRGRRRPHGGHRRHAGAQRP